MPHKVFEVGNRSLLYSEPTTDVSGTALSSLNFSLEQTGKLFIVWLTHSALRHTSYFNSWRIGIIMRRIKGIPEFDRPREKMEKKGPAALSNLELLAVLLGSGIKGKDVFEVA